MRVINIATSSQVIHLTISVYVGQSGQCDGEVICVVARCAVVICYAGYIIRQLV